MVTVINKNGSSTNTNTNTNTNTASSAVGGGICDGSVINSRKYITTSNVTANDKENVLKKDNHSNKTSKTDDNGNGNDNDNGNDKGISCNIHELLLSSAGNKKKNNSTTTTTTTTITTTKMPMPMPISIPIIQESNDILSRSYDTIKKEISKNVVRHKLQKLRHLVLPGVISTKYLDNEIFYPMHQQKLFQPQTVTYNGGIANVKKWKISSYLEVMEGGVPVSFCTTTGLNILHISYIIIKYIKIYLHLLFFLTTTY